MIRPAVLLLLLAAAGTQYAQAARDNDITGLSPSSAGQTEQISEPVLSEPVVTLAEGTYSLNTHRSSHRDRLSRARAFGTQGSAAFLALLLSGGMLSPFFQGCQTHQATCFGLVGELQGQLEQVALEKTDPALNRDTEEPLAVYNCEPLYNHGCTYCEMGLCLLWNDAGESCLS